MNATILTASGRHIDLLRPDPALIDINDIAHALSNLCRFTGHTREFYSVAEHSVRVSGLVPRELALEALLHDAAEAYVGDVSSPLKAQLHEYRNIEFSIDQAIRQRFGLPAKQSREVKHADLVMLATERFDLMPDTPETWEILQDVAPSGLRVSPVSPTIARRWFLEIFDYYSTVRPVGTVTMMIKAAETLLG